MFGKFGDHELNRSQINPEERSKKVYTAIKGMSVDLVGQEVRIRARLHNCREQGSLCFMVLRESYETI
jgi:aspartyl/asparaginyl-tRNA synthetase